MIKHINLTNNALASQIKGGHIRFGGNMKLKIYGTLNCKSGKRMKRENRIFFLSERDALLNGYRPCGHCMRREYKKWKDESV